MADIRTSRGQIVETEEVLGNLLAAVEHIFDLPDITQGDLENVAKLREARNTLTKSIFPEVDTNFHCIYKHLILCKTQLKELIQSLNQQEQDTSNLRAVLSVIEEVLHYTRLRYLKADITKLDDVNCIRCLEDYHLNKDNLTTEENGQEGV